MDSLELKARGEKLYQITTAYFCCGVTTVPASRVGPVINQAAPIMNWAKGKTLHAIKTWVRSKGGTMIELPQ